MILSTHAIVGAAIASFLPSHPTTFQCLRARARRARTWLKFKNPAAPAVKREAEGGSALTPGRPTCARYLPRGLRTLVGRPHHERQGARVIEDSRHLRLA